jgi:hypothetical protein
MKSIA